MLRIRTCPICSHELQTITLTSNPPSSQKKCLNCGYVHENVKNGVHIIPFKVKPSLGIKIFKDSMIVLKERQDEDNLKVEVKTR